MTLTNLNQLTNPTHARAINVYKNAVTGIQNCLDNPNKAKDIEDVHKLLLVAFTNINKDNDCPDLATALIHFCTQHNIPDVTVNEFLELGNPDLVKDIEERAALGAGCQEGGSKNCASCGGCQPEYIPENWQLTIPRINTICHENEIPHQFEV
ncbi:hypothetical protein DID76_02140 [Candidatus Marinamargulisbacteria bacterium SCGC AG-414-C22]|nr:hypothetical protein DID76_02140 [Candidatus Marinamargulisbacteria bacterium SCGC AG-414-C22]